MRKLMMAAVAVAGLAVMPGCQRSNNNSAASGEVQDQRSQVAKAQEEVGQANREAHESLNEQTADARQQVGQDVAQAQEKLSAEQQKLTQAQGQQQQGMAESGTTTAAATTVQGSLQSKDEDMLVLTVAEQGNRQLRLKMDDQTRVMQDNREVKLDDIQEGSQVRASYVSEGEDMLARDITVVTPAKKK